MNYLNYYTTVTTDIDSLKEAVTQPIFKGIEWIIVSLGGDGAFHQTFYKYSKNRSR